MRGEERKAGSGHRRRARATTKPNKYQPSSFSPALGHRASLQLKTNIEARLQRGKSKSLTEYNRKAMPIVCNTTVTLMTEVEDCVERQWHASAVFQKLKPPKDDRK